VYIIPLVVPCVFKLFWQPPAPGPDNVPAASGGARQFDAEREAATEDVFDDAGYEGDDDEAAASVNSSFKYDWDAYHRAFGNTPFDVAVTEMFVEYAALYQRMAGYAGSVFPKEMTLPEAEDIQKQATSFINDMVTPLLGPINSTKIHRLFCHVYEAIRDHGSLRNSNTAENECKHKEDKAHYANTNKDPKTFTRQVVRHAQGSRAVKAQLEREGAAAKAARRDSPAVAAASTGVCRGDRSDSDSSSDSSSSDESGCDAASTDKGTDSSGSSGSAVDRSSDMSGAAAARSNAAPTKGTYHLDRTTVSAIADMPGLTSAAMLLRMNPNDVVSVSKSLTINGRFDCGTVRKQIVRGTPDYRGAPWYDSVFFRTGSRSNRVHVGEVRALVRKPEGDVALVVEMAPATEVPGCPLSRKGCLRLRWNFKQHTTDCVARAVPLDRIRRVIHVVPDFKDLAERQGHEARPASPGAPPQERREMRYYLNALYPWDAS